MAIYTENLYVQLIEQIGEQFDKLAIISGYASANFLYRVSQDFPHLSIELIIGMARQGISKQDHEMFQKICKDNAKINVFYQIEDQLNHMKIYQWYLNDDPVLSYVGSANFSQTGFEKNQEILVPVLEDFSNMLKKYRNLSLSCLDPNILEHINLYENDYLERDEITVKAVNPDNNTTVFDKISSNVSTKYQIGDIIETYSTNQMNISNLLIGHLNIDSLEQAKVQIILPNDLSYDTRGVNAWNRPLSSYQDTYLNLTHLGISTDEEFFLRDKILTLIDDTGVSYLAKRMGNYGRELKFLEPISFYEFICQKIDKPIGELITYKDLKKINKTNIVFYKLEDTKYVMKFE